MINLCVYLSYWSDSETDAVATATIAANIATAPWQVTNQRRTPAKAKRLSAESVEPTSRQEEP